MQFRPSRRDVLRGGLIAGGAVAARGLSPALAQAIAATPPACGTDQHAMWNHGKLDKWVTRHLVSDPGGNGKFAAITVGYCQGSPARDHSGDVDLYWALADNFTICDNYHCSVIGGTDINRLYSVTGTADPDCCDGGGQPQQRPKARDSSATPSGWASGCPLW